MRLRFCKGALIASLAGCGCVALCVLRDPFFALEQQWIVVSSEAPADAPAAHLSYFISFVVYFEPMRKSFIKHLICRLR